MNPTDQQIAIAKVCGWILTNDGCPTGWLRNSKWVGEIARSVPNYPHDLNAMHEAEEVLTDEQKILYMNRLAELTNFQGNEISEEGYTCHTLRLFAFLTATAAQRAEAFLRTLNLWKD